MHHTTPYDLIVTASVISTILLIACKPEWCARQVWRLLRVVVPAALVGLELELLFTAPHLTLALLAIALVCHGLWRFERARRDLSNPNSLDPTEDYSDEIARWQERQALERRNLQRIGG